MRTALLFSVTKFFNLATLKCTFVVIFLLDDVTLLLYTLLILKISHLFFFRLKKMRPSSKIGPAMAEPSGPVPPGLVFNRVTTNTWTTEKPNLCNAEQRAGILLEPCLYVSSKN